MVQMMVLVLVYFVMGGSGGNNTSVTWYREVKIIISLEKKSSRGKKDPEKLVSSAVG